MADGPSLTRAIAAAIGDVVAADPACRRLIPEVSLYNAAQQAAGGLRNAVNMLFEARAKQFYEELNARPQSEVSAGQIAAARHQWQWVQAEGYAEACTGIVDVTQRAINAAIRKGTLSQGVTKAVQVDRFPKKDNNVSSTTALQPCIWRTTRATCSTGTRLCRSVTP